MNHTLNSRKATFLFYLTVGPPQHFFVENKSNAYHSLFLLVLLALRF